jgi:hypothetical protein
MTCALCPPNLATCCTNCKRAGVAHEWRDGALVSILETVVATKAEILTLKKTTLGDSGTLGKKRKG